MSNILPDRVNKRTPSPRGRAYDGRPWLVLPLLLTLACGRGETQDPSPGAETIRTEEGLTLASCQATCDLTCCAPPQGAVCTNTRSDLNNCGGCGVAFACAPGTYCRDGACKTLPPTTTTSYVNKQGNDQTGDGGQGSPWLTINQAVNHAQPGTTILIGAGTYSERVTVPSGTAGGPIVIAPDPASAVPAVQADPTQAFPDGGPYVTVDGTNNDAGDRNPPVFELAGVSDVTLMGLHIVNSGYTDMADRDNTVGGIDIRSIYDNDAGTNIGSQGILLANNRIEVSESSRTDLLGGANPVSIRGTPPVSENDIPTQYIEVLGNQFLSGWTGFTGPTGSVGAGQLVLAWSVQYFLIDGNYFRDPSAVGIETTGNEYSGAPMDRPIAGVISNNTFVGEALDIYPWDDAAQNGDFEDTRLTYQTNLPMGWAKTGSFSFATAPNATGSPNDAGVCPPSVNPDVHCGAAAGLVGSPTQSSGDSSLTQVFRLQTQGPPGGPLSFWYNQHCGDSANDWMQITLTDSSSGTVQTLVPQTCTNSGWKEVGVKQLNAYDASGVPIQYTLVVTNHDGGTSPSYSYTAVDDLKVTIPPSPSYAVYLQATNSINVERNFFHGCGYGVGVFTEPLSNNTQPTNDDQWAKFTWVRDNVFLESMESDVVAGSFGGGYGNIQDLYVTNNTVYRTGATPVPAGDSPPSGALAFVASPSSSITSSCSPVVGSEFPAYPNYVGNNTVVTNGVPPIYVDPQNGSVTIDHNLWETPDAGAATNANTWIDASPTCTDQFTGPCTAPGGFQLAGNASTVRRGVHLTPCWYSPSAYESSTERDFYGTAYSPYPAGGGVCDRGAAIFSQPLSYSSTWGPTQTWWTSGFYVGYETLVGDVDGDGRADLVGVGGGNVGVILSTGGSTNGAFGNPQTWFNGSVDGTYGTLLGDVDGDGRADLVALGTGGVNVYLSTGSGFASPTSWRSSRFYAAYGTFLGDVDGDGLADVVGISSASVGVLFSTGSGFTYKTAWSKRFSGTYQTFLGDVDGDGRADLVASNTGNIQVILSTGRGFGTLQTWQGTPIVGGLADLNGDGRADLVTWGPYGQTLQLSSGGSFGTAQSWGNGFYGTQETLLGDVNGDLRADMIALNNDAVWVELASPTGP
jgi:hypothetical protein